MTAEIINLKRARKAKARTVKEVAAELNRAKSGRTKAERERSAAEDQMAARRLDGHRLIKDDDEPGANS